MEINSPSEGGTVALKRVAEFASTALEALELYWKIEKFNQTLADELYDAFCHEHNQLAKCSDALTKMKKDAYAIKWFRIGDKHKHSTKIKAAEACVDVQEKASHKRFKTLKFAAEHW